MRMSSLSLCLCIQLLSALHVPVCNIFHKAEHTVKIINKVLFHDALAQKLITTGEIKA